MSALFVNLSRNLNHMDYYQTMQFLMKHCVYHVFPVMITNLGLFVIYFTNLYKSSTIL